MSVKKNMLTKEGYEKLVAERHELQQEKLPEIMEKLKDALAHGDLSENAEYHAAKDEKGLVEKRVSDIDQILEDYEIVEEHTDTKNAEISFGSVVTFQLEGHDPETVTIVGSSEADIDNNESMHISFESPIGSALRGKKAGDTGTVKLGGNREKIQILKVA